MPKQLRDVAEIHYGKSPADVLHIDGEVPVIGTGGTYGRAARPLFFGPAVVVPRKGSLSNTQYVDGPFWPADTTYAVLPKKEIDSRWLYYNLDHFDLTKLNEATGVPSISRDWLYKVPFYDADHNEQQSIAEILSTVDEAIEHTEALIAKTQQIKTGLMHDLLTRGVTPDGQLRPPREQAPELYKESPLGWIPKDWTSERVSTLTTRVGSGITPTGGSDVYVDDGVIFLRSQNVVTEGLDLSDVAFIDHITHNAMAASEIFPFDVLLNITGASIGRCSHVPMQLGLANTNQHVCCIRPVNPNQTDAIFLSTVLSSPIGQSQIYRLNAGSNREGLNYQQIRSFNLP